MSSPATYRAFSTEQFGRARDVLAEVQLPLQAPAGRDLRVRVRSGAINPVDVKVLHNFSHATGKADKQIVPGWDAAGVVEAVGEGVQNFKVGDEVVFAGVISRHGSFGEVVLVDERIVGKKPRSLSWDQAAAFPLTMLTAWEGLVEELGIPVPATAEDEKKNAAKSLLVIAGAGGVGSQAIQVAKHVLKIGKVVATASRPETIAYCKSLGADFTVSHREPLLPQLKALGLDGTNFIFNCDYTDAYIEQMVAIVLPFGGIVNINDPKKELALGGLFAKRASIHFELMFSRALFNVEPERQGAILNAASELFDKGVLKSTLTKIYIMLE